MMDFASIEELAHAVADFGLECDKWREDVIAHVMRGIQLWRQVSRGDPALCDGVIGACGVFVKTRNCARSPALPGFWDADEVHKELGGNFVEAVFVRDGECQWREAQQAVEHRFVELMIIFEAAIDDAGVIRG